MGKRNKNYTSARNFHQNSNQNNKETYLEDDDEALAIDIQNDGEGEGVDKKEVEAFMKKLGLDEIPEDVKLNAQKKKHKKQLPKGKEPVLQATIQSTNDLESDSGNPCESKNRKKKKKNKKSSSERAPIQFDEISSSSSSGGHKLPCSHDILISLNGKWYEDQILKEDPKQPTSDHVIRAKKEEAKTLFEKEEALYEKKYRGDDRDQTQWMKTVVTSGVLADKVAALSLRIQEAPVHSLSSLDLLLAMVKKKGKREILLGMDALRRLFLEELLPGDRKLKMFEQHAFQSDSGQTEPERRKKLILFCFEAQLKSRFQDFVNILQTLSVDNITAVNRKVITTIYELLVNKPEQEKTLLTMLVNKIGDPDNKMATATIHWLRKLVEHHPSMKPIVVKEVESLLYRRNIDKKAQYFCMCFLNQLILSADEADLATKLIVIYFTFFNTWMEKKEKNQKMLSALLSGVNRAYHYSNIEDEKVNEQMDNIFRIVQQSSFRTALQALMLLRQVLASRHTMTDRYYSSLYKKILDPALKTSSWQAMFLNLLFKTMKGDTNTKRIQAFIKRILQVCNSHSPGFICGALFMISEVIKKRPQLKTFKQWMEESDDEEHFYDIKVDGDVDDDGEDNGHTEQKDSKQEEPKVPSQKEFHSSYNPFARNPSFCGAESSALWELKKLTGHYHPSVSLFASNLLNGEKIEYAGNPLQDFTLIKFLDRYVYRNPKKQTDSKPSVLASKLSSERPVVINSKNFLTLPSDKIPLDAQFFFKYFSEKEELNRRKKLQGLEKKMKKKGLEDDDGTGDMNSDEDEDDDVSQADSDVSSVDDEEFEQILEEQMDLSDEDFDLDDDEDDDYIKEEGDEDSSEDEKLDFAGEFGRKKSKTKRKEEEGDSDEDGGQEEEEMKEEFDVENEEFDEEGFEASDDEEFEEWGGEPSKSTTNTTRKRKAEKVSDSEFKKKKKAVSEEDPELLGNADEFAAMIDEAAGAKFDNMSMHALANKDKANLKQLKWEENRDKWIQGRDTKSIIKRKRRNKQYRGGLKRSQKPQRSQKQKQSSLRRKGKKNKGKK